jgi:hypothetical protein
MPFFIQKDNNPKNGSCVQNISHEGTKTRRLAQKQTSLCFRDVEKVRTLAKSKCRRCK